MTAHDLKIVDAHCHLWNLDLALKYWLSPDWEVLCRHFQPDDAVEASGELGVESLVAIECGSSEEENIELENMAASSYVKAIAPFVDLQSKTLEQELDRWMQHPKCIGVRMRFEDDRDMLERPAVIDGLRIVARRGLIFDYLARDYHLQDILNIQDKVPQLKAVIEHMAKPNLYESENRKLWEKGMMAIAANTNIHCKLSLSPRNEQVAGLVANGPSGWSAETFRPYVQFILEHFDHARLMWGSDYPISLLTASYADTYKAMRDAIGPLDFQQEKQLFRDNAIAFYGITADG